MKVKLNHIFFGGLISLLVGCNTLRDDSEMENSGVIVTDNSVAENDTLSQSDYFLKLNAEFSNKKKLRNDKLTAVIEEKEKILNGNTVSDETDLVIDSLILECEVLQQALDSLLQLIEEYKNDSLEIDTSMKVDSLIADSNYIQDAIIRFGKDNFQGNWSNDNSGATTCIAVGTYDNSTINRTVFKWDEAQLEDYNQIEKIELVLSTYRWVPKSNSSPDGYFRIYLSPILKSWNEGTVQDAGTCYSQSPNTASINGVTGSSRSFGEQWSVYGVGLDNDDASLYVTSDSKALVNSNEKFVFDVTNDFKAWRDGKADNFGWVLSNPREFNGIHETYPELVSSDSPDLSLKPKLLVYYK